MMATDSRYVLCTFNPIKKTKTPFWVNVYTIDVSMIGAAPDIIPCYGPRHFARPEAIRCGLGSAVYRLKIKEVRHAEKP